MKRKKELIVILSSLLVIVLSVSVAYFTTKILGTGKEISVESADLKVIFTSGSGTINGTNIEPGWSSAENTFTVKNESNGTYKYNIIIKDLVNTFVTEGFLQYKITSSDGGYNMTDFVDVPKSSTAIDTILAKNISIEKGKTHTYKIIINYNNSEDVDQSADMDKMLSGKIFITEATNPTLVSKLLEDNPTIGTRNDFSTPFTTNTANTLYKATENGTDVYYFAGQDTTSTPINNWVKFGKANKNECTYNGSTVLYFNGSSVVSVENESQCLSSKICRVKLEEIMIVRETVTEDFCTSDGAEWTNQNAKWSTGTYNIYWRIIRTNADGSIRLLYHGTSTTATDAYIGISKFNTNYNSPKYVGYMYGNTDATPEEARTNTNDSTIKAYIDNWYANNMTSYTKYLSTTAVYCNDRELASGATYSISSDFDYAAYTRLRTNKTPTYDCTNDNDKFTVDASTGNGKLTHPIALMTADEIAYAGGVALKNAPMWYYTNSSLESSTGGGSWWSLSPRNWSEVNSDFNADSWLVLGSGNPGNLFSGAVGNSLGVRPAVSLKTCTLWTSGNGTSGTPYEIVETSSGC